VLCAAPQVNGFGKMGTVCVKSFTIHALNNRSDVWDLVAMLTPHASFSFAI
jgi:hypothetical protein